MQLSPEQARALLELARGVIRSALRGEQVVIQPPVDPALGAPAGAFVSLHELKTHRLRGCVGRLDAGQPMYQAVAHAAKSVLGDPRFLKDRVLLNELPRLEIEISLLAPLRPADNAMDFDLLNDGIFLTIEQRPGDNRSGCFLPQVARETGWSKEQLLDRLTLEKLGLPAKAWSMPNAKLEKFATLLIEPEPFGVA
jgi:AmmeMemoRadiSam system protein A